MNSLAKTLTTLVVDKACCNGNKRTLNLDLSAYAKLATLEIHPYSFMWAKSLKMVGMKSLKRVVIWDNCFRECVDGSFELEKCPKMRELVIGDFSFLCFKTCSIEKCPMLETVSIGRFREFMSFSSFATTSLRMTSNWCVRGEEIDLRKLRVASFGSRCFQGCQSVVFEGRPEVIV